MRTVRDIEIFDYTHSIYKSLIMRKVRHLKIFDYAQSNNILQKKARHGYLTCFVMSIYYMSWKELCNVRDVRTGYTRMQ